MFAYPVASLILPADERRELERHIASAAKRGVPLMSPTVYKEGRRTPMEADFQPDRELAVDIARRRSEYEVIDPQQTRTSRRGYVAPPCS